MNRNPTDTDSRTDEKTTARGAEQIARAADPARSTQRPAERLTLLLDTNHPEGRMWLEHYGVRTPEREPVMREVYAGVHDCEDCGDHTHVYKLKGSHGGVYVCRECFESYDWVRGVREA